MPIPAAPKPHFHATFSPNVPQTSGAMTAAIAMNSTKSWKGTGTARIVDGVKIADLAGDIGLEKADTKDKAQQGDEKRRFLPHQASAPG